MTRFRGRWTAAAAATLFLLGACAQPGAVPGTGSSAPPGSADASAAPGIPADGLVLRVRREGGFVTPDMLAGRIPEVSLYGDGRLITVGPQIAIYPGPAMPNLQVQQLDPATVDALIDKATVAGVRSGADFGRPNVADAPSTRVDVVAGSGTQTVIVEALGEARSDDPQLSQAQRDARTKLAAFVTELADLPTAAGAPQPQAYRAETLAALARPYVKPADGLPSQPPAVAWPGPALPGEGLSSGIELGCVTAAGADRDKVLAAATDANANTPWTSGGKTYLVTFRPLLPDEPSCATLKAMR
jgi:hypothetical protein